MRNEMIRAGKAAFSDKIIETALPHIRCAAKGYGYAVALHGSCARDLDLVAVPWALDAVDQDEIANIICGVLRGFFSRAVINGEGTLKPHGRMAYTIVLQDCPLFVDLSVMPTLESEDE